MALPFALAWSVAGRYWAVMSAVLIAEAAAMAMHYPRRVSRIKRKRAIGFRARMRTKSGRKMINRKRRAGRSLNTADRR